MKYILAVLLILVCAAQIATGAVATSTSKQTDTDTVAVIIGFDSVADRDTTVITAAGGTVTGGQDIDLVPVLFAVVPHQALADLRAHPDIRYVERDTDVEIDQTVPWGIDRVNATAARTNISADTQSAVEVAVIDTGIDHDHPDLQANVQWGVNTVGTGPVANGTVAADDNSGHGTHVAGTIAAQDNDQGVIGVAPSAQLYSIKVLDSQGGGNQSDLIEGIEASLDGPDGKRGTADDADILTMSLGTDAPSQALEQTINEAANESLLIAAAGNNGDGDPTTDNVTYPAKFESVIAVGATNVNDRIPSWSSEGSSVELAAPGASILSTYSEGRYANLSGTSMAAPHVAGTAALIIAKDRSDGYRNLSDAEVRDLLIGSTIDLGPAGRDNESGYGLIQADIAVRGWLIPLTVTANRTTMTVGETVMFTIRRNDTDALVNASLTVGDVQRWSGINGTVTYHPREAGNITATATKAATEFETYRNASTNVTVERRSVNLSLVANRTVVSVNHSVQFTLRRADTGARTNGSIHIKNTTRQTTPRGYLNFSFMTNGTYTVTANKPPTAAERFNNASVSITVTNSSGVDVNDNGRPARDLDDDGFYEDVDGSGRFSLNDLTVLWAHRKSTVVRNNKVLFDFDGNGRFSLNDITALWQLYLTR